jgi:hypothetical protein
MAPARIGKSARRASALMVFTGSRNALVGTTISERFEKGSAKGLRRRGLPQSQATWGPAAPNPPRKPSYDGAAAPPKPEHSTTQRCSQLPAKPPRFAREFAHSVLLIPWSLAETWSRNCLRSRFHRLLTLRRGGLRRAGGVKPLPPDHPQQHRQHQSQHQRS